MARENLTNMRTRAAAIEERLFAIYGEGECSLDHADPFSLTIAVILSAQCTDAAVNKVTPALFAKYPTPADLAAAKLQDVEDIIHPLGFFHSKAKNLIACAQKVVADYGGEIPESMEGLQSLPGVGRKTANVVMCQAFRNAQGIAVDTHVFRIAHRLGFATRNDDTPDKVEAKLLKVYPQTDWLYINHQWVHFGREFCSARNPKCLTCPIHDLCPRRGV
jgi:endonuclease-3